MRCWTSFPVRWRGIRRRPIQGGSDLLPGLSEVWGTTSPWPNRGTNSPTFTSATSCPPITAGSSCHRPAAQTATPTPTRAGPSARCGARATTGTWRGVAGAALCSTRRSPGRPAGSGTSARYLCGKTSKSAYRTSEATGRDSDYPNDHRGCSEIPRPSSSANADPHVCCGFSSANPAGFKESTSWGCSLATPAATGTRSHD